MKREAATDIPGADERRREQDHIHREYPDLYYYVAGAALVVAFAALGRWIFPDRTGYGMNLWSELASIAVTVFILDRRAQAREKRWYKQDLIFRMGSQVNHEAVRAAEELATNEWLYDGSLRGVDLSRGNLHGAALNDADLSGACLRFSDLSEAKLLGANLANAELVGANLTNAKLIGAALTNANLTGAKLINAELLFADLSSADMTAADLSNANLQDADLKGAEILDHLVEGIEFASTTLKDAVLPDCQIWHPGYDMSIFTDPQPDNGSSRNPP